MPISDQKKQNFAAAGKIIPHPSKISIQRILIIFVLTQTLKNYFVSAILIFWKKENSIGSKSNEKAIRFGVYKNSLSSESDDALLTRIYRCASL